MNIKEFLIANYIWILVIILLAIVTIIGFLAEKSRTEKKDEKKKQEQQTTPPVQVGIPQQQSIQMQPVNNDQFNMQYQGMGMQQPMQQMAMMPQQQDMLNKQMMSNVANNQMVYQDSSNQMNFQMPNDMQMGQNNVHSGVVVPVNNQSIVENTTQLENTSSYQPLSEQTPKFAPQPVLNFNSVSESNIQASESYSMPVEQNVSAMQQPVQIEQMNQMPQSMMQSQFVQPQSMTMNTVPTVQETTSVAMPIQSSQPIVNQFDSQSNGSQMINQGVVPQPIIPQMIMQPEQYGGIPSYNQIPQQIMPQVQQMPNYSHQGEQQPLNFVFGPPNDNNSNM